MVKFQAIKFRLMDTIIIRDESPTAAKFVPGFLAKGVLAYFSKLILIFCADFLKWLATQFHPEQLGEEILPNFQYDENGWKLLGLRDLCWKKSE